MKLLQKNALYLLVAALPIAILGSLALNWFIHKQILNEVDEQLLSDLKTAEQRLLKADTLQILNDFDDNPHIEKISKNEQLKPTFSDIIEHDFRENEPTEVRVLKATIHTSNQNFLMVVKQPYAEFKEIANSILIGVVLCFILLIIALLCLNFWFSKQLWQPFYAILEKLRNYNLDKSEGFQIENLSIHEFSLLGKTLNEMSEKIGNQYQIQKQFTENASHEMQTPLAVISTELESLLQAENLPEKVLVHIQKSTDAVNRLSALNKALLLLTKIENKQFSELKSVNISQLVEHLLHSYEDFATHRNITIEKQISPDCLMLISPFMAEILLSNLLKNAIRHNMEGGKIECIVTKNYIKVLNTGEPLPFPKEQLFERFIKNPEKPEALGLGLSIVAEIAKMYHLKLNYHFEQGIHEFSVFFV